MENESYATLPSFFRMKEKASRFFFVFFFFFFRENNRIQFTLLYRVTNNLSPIRGKERNTPNSLSVNPHKSQFMERRVCVCVYRVKREEKSYININTRAYFILYLKWLVSSVRSFTCALFLIGKSSYRNGVAGNIYIYIFA